MAQDSRDGFIFECAYTLDLASNINGGIDQGFAYLGNIDLNVTFNTEKLGLWEGGQFYVYLLNNHGNSLSALMGDFQIANNIEAESNSRLYEFWYKHHFKNATITLGQHDLNSVFAISIPSFLKFAGPSFFVLLIKIIRSSLAFIFSIIAFLSI